MSLHYYKHTLVDSVPMEVFVGLLISVQLSPFTDPRMVELEKSIQQSTETGGKDGCLFGILIEPSCSQRFKIRLTATPVRAPCANA